MEKIPIEIYEDSKKASICVAAHIAELISQRTKQGKKTVLV